MASGIGRKATHEDLEAALGTLAVAFESDPLWGEWAFPKERALELRRVIFEPWLKSSLRSHGLRVTGGCGAVAAWFPPGAVESTPEELERQFSLVRELLGTGSGRFIDVCNLIETSHPKAKPHYYLSLLGTHAVHRGKGLGMALLRDCLEGVDAAGMPAYLESSNPGNVARYEAVGFEVIGGFTLPGGGPRIDTMWREPRARG